jgi:hypothetical protein
MVLLLVGSAAAILLLPVPPAVVLAAVTMRTGLRLMEVTTVRTRITFRLFLLCHCQLLAPLVASRASAVSSNLFERKMV